MARLMHIEYDCTARHSRMNHSQAIAAPGLDNAVNGLARSTLPDGRKAIIKKHAGAPPGFFAAEARGLRMLRDTQCLRVPEVWAWAAHGIVLEDLGQGQPSALQWQRGGMLLARQHTIRDERFGLQHDGWCGDSPQANTPDRDGWRFFAEQRLLVQARRARDAALLEARDMQAVERLCGRLRDLVPAQAPSLLHGDLWRANLHAGADGELALIDAGAVHYGWHEAELSMLTLFGEPPAAFFDTYQEASGCAPDWRERAPLYNLYHLLNHLNLFGRGYLGAVRDILRRWT